MGQKFFWSQVQELGAQTRRGSFPTVMGWMCTTVEGTLGSIFLLIPIYALTRGRICQWPTHQDRVTVPGAPPPLWSGTHTPAAIIHALEIIALLTSSPLPTRLFDTAPSRDHQPIMDASLRSNAIYQLLLIDSESAQNLRRWPASSLSAS